MQPRARTPRAAVVSGAGRGKEGPPQRPGGARPDDTWYWTPRGYIPAALSSALVAICCKDPRKRIQREATHPRPGDRSPTAFTSRESEPLSLWLRFPKPRRPTESKGAHVSLLGSQVWLQSPERPGAGRAPGAGAGGRGESAAGCAAGSPLTPGGHGADLSESQAPRLENGCHERC